MLTTIEGTYEEGRIALAELPSGIERARVFVTFLVEPSPAGTRDEAAQQLLTMMRAGVDIGGPPYPQRDSLYDRGA